MRVRGSSDEPTMAQWLASIAPSEHAILHFARLAMGERLPAPAMAFYHRAPPGRWPSGSPFCHCASTRCRRAPQRWILVVSLISTVRLGTLAATQPQPCRATVVEPRVDMISRSIIEQRSAVHLLQPSCLTPARDNLFPLLCIARDQVDPFSPPASQALPALHGFSVSRVFHQQCRV